MDPTVHIKLYRSEAVDPWAAGARAAIQRRLGGRSIEVGRTQG
jgi:hypothetical protein